MTLLHLSLKSSRQFRLGLRQVLWGVCRDDARNVLVAMMAELGAQYLYFAIQVLHNACPAKGYTAHVLGYTLHAILETISKVSYAHHIMHNLISVFVLSSEWTDAQNPDVV